MVVVIGMPETTALERIWICTQSVHPLVRQMRKCKHFLAFLTSLISSTMASAPVCSLCVQSSCSSNENMQVYFRLTRFDAFVSGESVMSTPGKTPQGERCDEMLAFRHNRAEDVSAT